MDVAWLKHDKIIILLKKKYQIVLLLQILNIIVLFFFKKKPIAFYFQCCRFQIKLRVGSICPYLNVSTKSTSSAAYSGSSKWRSKPWWIRFPSNRQPCGTWLWHGDHWYGQCFFCYSFWRGKRRRQAKLPGIRAQYIPGPFVKACEPVVGNASWVCRMPFQHQLL